MIAEQEAADELQRTLRNGSEALLEKKYRFAINLYDKCFKVLQENSTLVWVICCFFSLCFDLCGGVFGLKYMGEVTTIGISDKLVLRCGISSFEIYLKL